MIHRFQYSTEEERSNILEDNKHLYLIKEENLFEGNFLTFTSVKPISEEIEELNRENTILKLQLDTITDRSDFLEGVLTEVILTVVP